MLLLKFFVNVPPCTCRLLILASDEAVLPEALLRVTVMVYVFLVPASDSTTILQKFNPTLKLSAYTLKVFLKKERHHPFSVVYGS